MRSIAWCLLLASNVFVHRGLASEFSAGEGSGAVLPSQNIALSLSTVPDSKGTLSLRLSLTNTGTVPLSILTGVVLGGTPYPAAAFRFRIEFRDHRNSELHCECSGPGVIGGTIAPYTVTVQPGKVFSTEVPMTAFRIINDGGRLCTPETQGARLTATLKGERWPNHGSDSQRKDSYWTGVVSESVPLACQRD